MAPEDSTGATQAGEDESIPVDAWAFRLYAWKSGEELLSVWHRTKYWLRRNGTYSGLVSVCRRVYNDETMELVGGDGSTHPEGPLCFECFGIRDSREITNPR
jgi:hypothetical protein